MAPELLAESPARQDSIEISGGTDGEGVALTVPDLAPDGLGVTFGISFTVDYATESDSVDSGLTVLTTTSDDVSAYVQPMATGVRVLTAIASAEAPGDYTYTFDVPEGTSLVEGVGRYYLSDDDRVLGALLPPWAVDAAGESVPTSYSWADGKLTQHVDLSSPRISFPVLADPAWGYAVEYKLTKTVAANKALLKKCFKCYFPVPGAPKAFPKVGQLLPLMVGPANFNCTFKNEFNATNWFAFQFDATKAHVDKLGSNIVFEFRALSNGTRYLMVSAYVVNDAFWLKNPAYQAGTYVNWKNFASNLNKA
ncbi:hypothetical protein [Glaciibacter psychrotolerans]|uniref:Uncharacterized protein n=1 Tax=Glaciibacter psychrotolerans TaxID=670054 RepID=A0A7Z0EDB4_9MICO|nr:hypothetical protein [Leifsonia psychrotolerans]NYJ19530.1 hypothetical protein [Leifsonia psychrotolerans]